MSSQFDATSMLGYLFQVRLALLDSLKRLPPPSSPNPVTALDLWETHFDNDHRGVVETSSKGSEAPREHGVAVFSRNWLGVRDDFRNWLVRAV